MQPAGDPNPLTGDDLTARAILVILLDHYPALLSIEELVSEYAGLSRDRQTAELMVADGLAALLCSGLIHKLNGFVFASRAAIRAGQLQA